MKESIDEKNIQQALRYKFNGIKDYLDLMDNLNNINEEFIRKYRKFYKMNMARVLSKKFYDVYFKYLVENLEESKSNSVNFECILRYLFKFGASNRVEASFSSKLLATINPNMPVWDTNVLSQLNISKPRTRKDDKELQIKETIDTYNKLIRTLNEDYLSTALGKQYIRIFDETFKNDFDTSKITPIKKIDLVLWSLGKKTIQ